MIEKINLQQTLDRWLAFVEHRLGGGILAQINYFDSSSRSANSNRSNQARIRECLVLEDPELCVSRAKKGIQHGHNSLSDGIPSVYPTSYFGESVWSAMFGGEITFAGTDYATWSYCKEPPVKDLAKFSFPSISSDNPWLQKMLKATEYFVSHMEPICDVAPFIIDDCLNLLVELRGACTAFTDLYDYSSKILSRFMDWSIEVNMYVYDVQAKLVRDFVDKAYGGHPFSRYSYCRIPSISVDAYGSCNLDIYRKYGLKQHQRLVSHYGGARLHLHANGRHLCELVSQIEGLTFCSMDDDAGYPDAWEILEELKERMSPVPISINIPKEKFLKRLHNRTLPGGVLYKLGADSLQEANDIMLKVFEYEKK
ncbi:MAG: hypothetical protein DDT40_00281 [candidate division WS2 bacterium]|nr:hypothetical protein [Candidatus Psychracetigena formicireducens]